MNYVRERIKEGNITVIHVQEKVSESASGIELTGQLSTEYLRALQLREKSCKELNDAPNRVLKKIAKYIAIEHVGKFQRMK